MIGQIIRKVANKIILAQGILRGYIWRPFLKKCGKNFQPLQGVRLLSPGLIDIGDNVFVNHNTDIYGQGGVSIGNNVIIGQNVNIMSVNHAYADWRRPIRDQGITTAKIVIEDDVWIGGNSTILPGVKIGRGAIVGANAVVTKDIEEYSIVGGVPARPIKKRFPEKILTMLRKKRIKKV